MSQQTDAAPVAVQTLRQPLNLQISSLARNLLERWKRVARKIGDFQARLLLMIFYIFILGPFALLIRWRGDPMRIKSRAPRGWLQHSESAVDPLERARQQF
jgi:hypothetical protein